VNEATGKANRWKDVKEDATKAYAAAEGIDEDSEEFKAITDAEVQDWMAYNKAIEDTNTNYEKYLELLEDSDKDWDALDNIKKTWKDQTKDLKTLKEGMSEYSDKIKQAKKMGQDWSEAFPKGSELKKSAKEMNKYADTIRDDLGEALDITTDEMKESVIDGEFVAENAELIEKAMQGNVDAIEELQDKAAHKILLSVDIATLSDDMQSC